MDDTTTNSSSNFEATVLREFGKVGTAIRKSSEATNKRIDRLGSSFSSRINGIELRLERNDVLTQDSLKRLGSLEKQSKNPNPRRGPFSITVSDLLGFLKILPLVATLGAGIAGLTAPSCSGAGSTTHRVKSGDAPSGTKGTKQSAQSLQ